MVDKNEHDPDYFKNWIHEKGVKHLSELLNVSTRTIEYWRSGDVIPTPKMMLDILNVSNGEITPNDILGVKGREYYKRRLEKSPKRKSR